MDHIDSPDRTKNSIKKKEKVYSQYFITVELNHEKIKQDREKITKCLLQKYMTGKQ